MKEFASSFIGGFCKVEFLCFDNEPNWLGWGVLGIGALMLLGIIGAILGTIFER